MSLRKFGTGEIIEADNPADEVKKTASTPQDRDQALAEVVEEQQKADED